MKNYMNQKILAGIYLKVQLFVKSLERRDSKGQ